MVELTLTVFILANKSILVAVLTDASVFRVIFLFTVNGCKDIRN